MKQRIHQMELFIKYPTEVQEEWRRNLISKAKDTVWGKQYEYASIRSYQDYINRVPIQDYDTLKTEIMRVFNGEQNILWPTDIKWFAKSSGTTSDKSKFIPVSIESLEECHFKGGKDMLSIYCNNTPNTNMFGGKSLTMGGSHQINAINADSFYGDISAIIIQNIPYWAEFIRTPGISITLMDNWEEKIEMMALATIKEDVTNISGVPTWTVVLIKRILELTGKSNLLDVWPNLELYVHGAVNFAPYKEQFQQLIPSKNFNYLETYNASEGFFAIQDQSNSNELLLMLDYGIFYEFIPMEEHNSDNPKTLTIGEVELNTNYAVVISTNAGLWRYKVGDTIMFTSLSPYRLVITGRTKHFINAFGEEVIIDNAEKAIEKACRETGAKIREYTAAPIYFSKDENGAHEWLIEFEVGPDSIENFTTVLDHTLKSVNSDYEAKRHKDIALRLLIVRNMPQGTFYNWLKHKGKLGGQHKVPRLCNNRQYVDEIIGMIA